MKRSNKDGYGGSKTASPRALSNVLPFSTPFCLSDGTPKRERSRKEKGCQEHSSSRTFRICIGVSVCMPCDEFSRKTWSTAATATRPRLPNDFVVHILYYTNMLKAEINPARGACGFAPLVAKLIKRCLLRTPRRRMLMLRFRRSWRPLLPRRLAQRSLGASTRRQRLCRCNMLQRFP